MIDQTIVVVKRNDRDSKLAGWMAMKLGNSFIREIDYEKLIEENTLKGNQNMMDTPPLSMSKPQIGITPIKQYDEENVQKKDNNLVRKRVKTDTSPGFGNIKFIIVTLIVSIVAGIVIGNLLMK